VPTSIKLERERVRAKERIERRNSPIAHSIPADIGGFVRACSIQRNLEREHLRGRERMTRADGTEKSLRPQQPLTPRLSFL